MADYRLAIEIKDDGLVVVLEDGSRWAISPGDNTKTLTWYPT